MLADPAFWRQVRALPPGIHDLVAARALLQPAIGPDLFVAHKKLPAELVAAWAK
jgi:hypothetical protein